MNKQELETRIDQLFSTYKRIEINIASDETWFTVSFPVTSEPYYSKQYFDHVESETGYHFRSVGIVTYNRKKALAIWFDKNK